MTDDVSPACRRQHQKNEFSSPAHRRNRCDSSPGLCDWPTTRIKPAGDIDLIYQRQRSFLPTPTTSTDDTRTAHRRHRYLPPARYRGRHTDDAHAVYRRNLLSARRRHPFPLPLEGINAPAVTSPHRAMLSRARSDATPVPATATACSHQNSSPAFETTRRIQARRITAARPATERTGDHRKRFRR